MLMLPSAHRLVHAAVLSVLDDASSTLNTREQAEGEVASRVVLADLDQAHYVVSSDKKMLTVEFNIACWRQIAPFVKPYDIIGVILKAVEVPDVKVAYDTDQANLVISFPLSTPLSADQKQTFATVVASLRTTVVGAVFTAHVDHLHAEADAEIPEKFSFALRPDTQIYIVPKRDRVIVAYQLEFHEEMENAIASVFLNEFVDSKRRLGSAPPCLYNQQPLSDLDVFKLQIQPKQHYISFTILPLHVEPDKRDKSVQLLAIFRDFLQYHIKNSKSFFHSRMRVEGQHLMKVLNRARVEPDDNRKKHTISGKSFIRQS